MKAAGSMRRAEGDPRGIVDTDVDELPTDAMMTIHRAAISSSDVMPNRTDATELFNIEVDAPHRREQLGCALTAC
jgi:hypothetical protein